MPSVRDGAARPLAIDFVPGESKLFQHFFVVLTNIRLVLTDRARPNRRSGGAFPPREARDRCHDVEAAREIERAPTRANNSGSDNRDATDGFIEWHRCSYVLGRSFCRARADVRQANEAIVETNEGDRVSGVTCSVEPASALAAAPADWHNQSGLRINRVRRRNRQSPNHGHPVSLEGDCRDRIVAEEPNGPNAALTKQLPSDAVLLAIWSALRNSRYVCQVAVSCRECAELRPDCSVNAIHVRDRPASFRCDPAHGVVELAGTVATHGAEYVSG